MTRAENAARAAELKAEGLNGVQIAERMGLSRSYAAELLTDPEGHVVRARKDSYRGTCELCGNPTDGSDGPNAPKVCFECIRWTREEVLAACDSFFAEHDRSPRRIDAIHSNGAVPTERAAVRLFGGWNEMLLAAGLPLNIDRRPETQADMERMLAAGSTVSEVAEAFGWTTANVHMRLYTRGLTIEDFGQRGATRWRAEREHIVRRWNEGASAGDIAQELDLPPGNIASRISRLRARGYDLPYRHRAAA
jgi:hypothetical protein